jgi:cell division protein FtsB
MPHLQNETLEIILYVFAALVLIYAGFRVGRLAGSMSAKAELARKEQDLFTAQKGFKSLYEQELSTATAESTRLAEQVTSLTARVEEYRKKAAGFGGLFSSGNKKNDAMYALLLENEALEEALYAQNEKLKTERADGLREQMRATSYRRVLMSQLLNDERIKGYVAEILSDERHLPAPNQAHANATDVSPTKAG